MKVYIWHGHLGRYTDGDIVVVAPSVKDARKLAKEKMIDDKDDKYISILESRPIILPVPFVYVNNGSD